MGSKILIGIGSGLAAAVMFAAVAAGSILALPLWLFAQLPIVIASLGWGSRSGFIAAAIASATIAFAINPIVALVFAATIAAPAAWLAHLLGLARADEEGGSEQWYPIGRIVFHGSLIIGIAFMGSALFAGIDQKAIADEVLAGFKVFLAAGNAPAIPTDAELTRFLSIYIAAIPFASPALSLAVALFNLWLAARIVRKSNRLTRPWENLAAFDLPNSAVVLLAICLGVSMLGGPVGFLARFLAGPLGLAYMLLGLAVLHTLTRGLGARPLILWAAYVSIIIVTIPAFIFAGLGLAENYLRLRDRRRGGSPPPADRTLN